MIPQVGPLKRIKLPTVAEAQLPNGLRVVVARRPGIPRFEARLVIPTARRTGADRARQGVLTRTLLSGTSSRSSVELAEQLQAMGGTLDAFGDSDEVGLAGSALAPHLAPFLGLLADVVLRPAFPADEVELNRERYRQELTLARSQPASAAREVLLRRLYGDHPYGWGMPADEAVAKVRPAALRTFHGQRLQPKGSVLVVVGDVRPAAALEQASEVFAGWPDGGKPVHLPVVAWPTPSTTTLIDRPGAVQTNVRIAGGAIGRTDPGYPALAVANLVFGGYFISRLVENIRERRGYTYSPGSGVHQHRFASHFSVQADVGTEVTAAALVEIRYELARMLVEPVEDSELLSAKRYLAGTLSMAIQTQSGLAAYLSLLASQDLPLEYLRDFPARAQALDVEDIRAAAVEHMAPRRLHTVLVGDASAVLGSLEAFEPIEVQGG